MLVTAFACDDPGPDYSEDDIRSVGQEARVDDYLSSPEKPNAIVLMAFT